MASGTSASEATEGRGYSEHKGQLLTRLRRVEGQIRGLQRMVDEERWCPDILRQVAAVQAAIDKVALGLAEDHARHCVVGGPDDAKDERTAELMAAMTSLVRRG